MSRYINLEDLVIAYSGHTPDDEFSQGVDFVLDKIYSMGKADVRPVVRGKWELDNDGLPVCSVCGEIALQRVFVKVPQLINDTRMVKSNFCPDCGADLRKEDEDAGRCHD